MGEFVPGAEVCQSPQATLCSAVVCGAAWAGLAWDVGHCSATPPSLTAARIALVLRAFTDRRLCQGGMQGARDWCWWPRLRGSSSLAAVTVVTRSPPLAMHRVSPPHAHVAHVRHTGTREYHSC